MSYKALYRTYRPQTFEDVAGQSHVTITLKNAIKENRIAHAYLFAGPRGTGKTTIAKILAKAINCTGDHPPCNECPNCKAITQGDHPDVIEIDAASNNGVNEVRDLIDKVKYAPINAKYKVYIIDEVHMMTPEAFNALLKTLEEPPAHIVFILATTEPHKILPTIISRCQRFDFKRVDEHDIISRLEYVLKEENVELLINGKRVENDYTFVADDEEMKVEISYTFNASALGGKNLVTFEELYDLSNPDEPVKVAEHKDIEDDGQTVLITERIIKIHTTATDKDGNKELEAGKDVTIIDTVTLEGLEVGTQYKLVGWQMLKEENAELLINGKRVESDYTFIADSEAMKVEVAFTFDATSLDGKQLVTFEELYDLSNPDEPKKVTEHKDIEDKGQTITFKEKPEEPEKPETPPTPEKPNRPSDSPKTGDSTNVMAFIVMLLASAGGLAGTYLYKRRKMKKS